MRGACNDRFRPSSGTSCVYIGFRIEYTTAIDHIFVAQQLIVVNVES